MTTQQKYIKKMQGHFTIGKIVKSYCGQDRVIAFNTHTNDSLHYGSIWSVDVVAIDTNGNQIGQIRRHCTSPRN